MLKKLLEFNNLNTGNKLIFTTHSPYLVNYMSIAIQGESLYKKVNNDRLNNIVPLKSVVSADDVVIYQFNEVTGVIIKLSNTEGIPSDNNYLNQSLRHGNEMFDELLEIEQEL